MDYLALKSYKELSFKQLLPLLQEADELYYNGDESELTDAEYDAAWQYAKKLQPNHSYFLGTGSEVRGGKVKLPNPMGSLDQIQPGELSSWIRKDVVYVATDKLDGYSAQLVYGTQGKLQIAYSKGDGASGADITRKVKQIKNVPQDIEENVTIRGEIIIPIAHFPLLQAKVKTRSGQPYRNPRNCVSGLMNASECPKAAFDYIHFVAYEIIGSIDSKEEQLSMLGKMGFTVATSSRFTNPTEDQLTKHLVAARKRSMYELDGIVLDINDPKIRAKLKTDSINPKYAAKYKVASSDNAAIATVIGVEFNVSKDGYLKPRINIEPVQLLGTTVQWCTGFNARFIIDNGVGPGAKISITRSGDVIPLCQNVVQPSKMMDEVRESMDTLGEWEWSEKGTDAVLVDVQGNETARFEQLLDFFTSLNIPALKEGNVKALFDAGYETPESIILLSKSVMQNVIGDAIGDKVFYGLKEKLNGIPSYVLMGAHPAFGRGVGERRMKKLYEAFDGAMSKCRNISSIIAVDGFDAKIANKIATGMPAYETFFKKVASAIILKQFEQRSTGGNMKDQVVVMTGFRDAEMAAAIEEQGGRVGSSVSSKTTILVTADPDSTSGKAAKARELGIKIMSIEGARKLLGIHPE